MSDNPVWLPNLVGGVSIWKLAPDLNETKFMGGRLLVPETEGTDSLPSSVRWDVADLVPLKDARAAYGADVDGAIRDFFACLESVKVAFSGDMSGYAKYRDAFTVPSLEADDGASYFYSPREKKLKVINWGASPRAIAGSAELFFGYQAFDRLAREAGSLKTAPGAAPAASPAIPPPIAADHVAPAAQLGPANPAKTDDEKKDEKEKEKKKEDEKARPWWIWVLVVLGLLAVILLVLWLMKACDRPAIDDGHDAALDALADGSETGGIMDAGADAAADATADAARDADASADAKADAADARADAAAGKDAGVKDSGSGSGGGGGGSGSGGKRTFKIVPKGGGAAVEIDGDRLPHREHFHPDAVKWRVESGRDSLVDGQPAEGTGDTFDVYLKPGASFGNVRVSWQDGAGRWHLH